MDRDAVTVLLPTYNEAETIGEVVEGFREQGFDDVLVMDGGSEDDTRAIAEAAGARVRVQSESGKGQAIHEAMAEHVDREYVLMADGDGTYRPEDADAMLAPLEEGSEHVIGDRFADMEEGAMSTFNRFGNGVFNWLFKHIHGEDLDDILSGYRAFTRDSYDRLRLSSTGFGIETEMTVECVKRDVPTKVVPITYLARPDASASNLHPLKDGGVILMEIYRMAKTNNPLFYFGSFGAIALVIGLLLGLYVGIEWVTVRVSHEVIAIVASFTIIFGVQLLMFAVLSDMLLTMQQEQLDRLEALEDE